MSFVPVTQNSWEMYAIDGALAVLDRWIQCRAPSFSLAPHSSKAEEEATGTGWAW